MPKRNLGDLTNHIFEAIQMLKDGDMDVETAKGIAQLAQVAVNATRTQIDGVRTFAALGGDFTPLAMEQGQNLLDGNNEMESEASVDPAETASYEFRRTEKREPRQPDANKKDVPPVSDNPFDGLRVTKTQKDILEFLIESGGESRIGLIGDSRAKTIRHLELLEEKGVIECVIRPERLAWGSETRNLPFEVLNYCGVWKIRKYHAQPASSEKAA